MPKIYTGPKGGKYYIKKGKKVYITKTNMCKSCSIKSSFG